MTEYIDKRQAISHPFANGRFDHKNANPDFILGYESYKEWLENLPPADVVPVVRGQWIGDAYGYLDEDQIIHDIWSCSCCGTVFEEFDEKPGWSYCPVCGADNRGEDDG